MKVDLTPEELHRLIRALGADVPLHRDDKALLDRLRTLYAPHADEDHGYPRE